MTNLLDLPTELIYQCIKGETTHDIQAIRLSCKRLSGAAAPLLTSRVKVNISSQSLARLDEISHNDTVRKSIRTVEINLSFYNAAMATDFFLFAGSCAANLFVRSEIRERMSFMTMALAENEDSEDDNNTNSNPFDAGYKISEEWTDIAKQAYHNKDGSTMTMTRHQTLLSQCHEEYARLFQDQQQSEQDNRHISRIVSALRRFPALEKIHLLDDVYRRMKNRKSQLYTHFSDEDLRIDCLKPHYWKGTHVESPTDAPGKFIPDFFTALHDASVYPRRFSVKITPPNDLRVLETSPAQRECIRNVLHKATHLEFTVHDWARLNSLAVNNSRPSDEIRHLGNLTSAFFAAGSVEYMSLDLVGFPAFYERPNLSLSQLLPLETRRWPKLKAVALSYPPCHADEIGTLLEYYGGSLEKLDLDYIYPLSGSWDEMTEYARSFQNIKDLVFKVRPLRR